VVLPLFSRFIPSCVHSEATCCIDSLRWYTHADFNPKRSEKDGNAFSTTMCYYVLLKHFIYFVKTTWKQGFKPIPRTSEANKNGRKLQHNATWWTRHWVWKVVWNTTKCKLKKHLMFQSCPFSTGPWQNSHCPCLQFGFPPYGCSWPVESFEWLGPVRHCPFLIFFDVVS
jgi:hypothetical protein